MEVVERLSVWLTPLDPGLGSEMQKTRPCVVVSPDEVNRHLNTVVVVPLTSVRRPYRMRVNVVFDGRQGQVAIDQVRVIDRQRLVSPLGRLGAADGRRVLATLREFFAE